jgi:ABC-type methionine transport system permease subunit
VFFPDTGRLVRLPLVDIGPGNSGAAKTAVADLTVAATAFLQRFTEKDIRKLDNIIVQARVIA